MLKPDKETIDRWIKAKSVMSFKLKNGRIKRGIINGQYILGLEVDFSDGNYRVVTFDSLGSITKITMVEK